MTTGQVVDTETAQEFMSQALEKASQADLGDILRELEAKSARFQALLAPEALPGLEAEQLRGLLRSVFATRRKAGRLLEQVGAPGLRSALGYLLNDSGPLDGRFRGFVDCLSGYLGDVRPPAEEDVPEQVWCDLASEVLHFTRPDEYWLWTRWMWDPRAGTGALPLVTMDGHDLHGSHTGETYVKVGVAVAFVRATGSAAGFARFGMGDSPFGVDVFLACVYAVYMYTTLRLRMTQEFNKVVPQLPELTRRLLGVWRLEL